MAILSTNTLATAQTDMDLALDTDRYSPPPSPTTSELGSTEETLKTLLLCTKVKLR